MIMDEKYKTKQHPFFSKMVYNKGNLYCNYIKNDLIKNRKTILKDNLPKAKN